MKKHAATVRWGLLVLGLMATLASAARAASDTPNRVAAAAFGPHQPGPTAAEAGLTVALLAPFADTAVAVPSGPDQQQLARGVWYRKSYSFRQCRETKTKKSKKKKATPAKTKKKKTKKKAAVQTKKKKKKSQKRRKRRR